MRPLRYSINVTLDGCVDHRVGSVQEDLHLHTARILGRSDALIFGRVTYEMMEAGWRHPSDDRAEWMKPFAETINAAKKYVVSSTMASPDWNAELVRGDLGTAIRRLKSEPGQGLYVGGVTLPLALAELDLIDEYEFMVHPTVAGHGPTLFAGLTRQMELRPVARVEFSSGVVSTRYVPVR